jgi:hypothetical protein
MPRPKSIENLVGQVEEDDGENALCIKGGSVIIQYAQM